MVVVLEDVFKEFGGALLLDGTTEHFEMRNDGFKALVPTFENGPL